MITTEDRKQINTALAKAIAYVNCGKHDKAQEWAVRLVQLLECKEILQPEYNESRENSEEAAFRNHSAYGSNY